MSIVHPHKFTDRTKIKVEYVTHVLSRYHALQLFTNIQIYMFTSILDTNTSISTLLSVDPMQ